MLLTGHPHELGVRHSLMADSLALHVVLALFLIKLSLLLCCCILILLVLADQIIHVTFCLCEFHLIHSFSCVPMQECFAAEHCCEELSNSFEHFLNGCRITKESDCHLQALGRNVTDASLDVVGDPLNEVR